MNAPNFIVWVDGVFHTSLTKAHAVWVAVNAKEKGAKEVYVYTVYPLWNRP